MFLDALVRRFPAAKTLAEMATALRLTGQFSLASAQVEAEGCEETRAGRRFCIGVGAATGIAPVQAVPTTAAQWVIWNGDPSKAYVFDQIGTFLISGTAGAGIVVMGTLFTAPSQQGVANASKMYAQNLSSGGLSSKSSIVSGIAITTPASGANPWMLLAKDDTTNTAVGSVAALNTDLKGRLILPPGMGLGLSVISPAGTTPLFVPHAMWTEKELDLE